MQAFYENLPLHGGHLSIADIFLRNNVVRYTEVPLDTRIWIWCEYTFVIGQGCQIGNKQMSISHDKMKALPREPQIIEIYNGTLEKKVEEELLAWQASVGRLVPKLSIIEILHYISAYTELKVNYSRVMALIARFFRKRQEYLHIIFVGLKTVFIIRVALGSCYVNSFWQAVHKNNDFKSSDSLMKFLW